jgi:hypothetical protein
VIDNVLAFPLSVSACPKLLAETIIATRNGTDVHGNRWAETIVRTANETFRLEVRSDDPDDCFDEELSLEQLLDYTRAAITPFMWAVY